MQKLVFESYTLAHADDNVQNPCYQPLGFINKLLSATGDPMSLSPVFAATQRISNAIGMLPWELKTYEDEEIPDSHWFYHLFDNCIQTQFIFTKNLIKDVITEGNGYALIIRGKNNVPESLVYLPPGSCSPIIDSTNMRLVYNVSFNGKLTNKYQPKDIIHVFMDSKDGIMGKALLDFANKSIKLASYTDKAAIDYYQSGMRITGVLSTDAPRLTDKQREDIRKSYLAGLESSNGIAVLEGNMHFENMSNNAKDAALIESRTYNVNDIARYYNISPVLLGNLEHTQYGSIEQASLDFVTNTLSSWLTMLEEELNRKLLSVDERKKYYIDLDEDILVKSDRSTYATYISTFLDKGVISINEARKMIGLYKIKDGDSYIIPYSGTTQNPSYNNSQQLDNRKEKDNEENVPKTGDENTA